MSEQDRYQALRASRLAAELTDEQCRTLAGKIEICDLANGELLVREGAPDDRLFFIVSGYGFRAPLRGPGMTVLRTIPKTNPQTPRSCAH